MMNNYSKDNDRTIISDFSGDKSGQTDRKMVDNGKDISIAKVLPDNIGDILYFDTTNNNAKPKKTKGQYLQNKIITVIVVVAVLATLYYLYRVFGWNEWLCGVIGFFTLLGGIGTIADLVFCGTDYFIGLKGFAVLKFKDERDNIVKGDEITFDEFDYLLHEETEEYVNGVYKHTSYKFTIIKDKETKTKLYKIEGSYNKDFSKDVSYKFAKNLEVVNTNIRFRSMMEQYAKQGFVEFFFFGTSFSFSITIYANGDVKLGEHLYKFEDIDSISCSKGYMVMNYHSKNKSRKHEIEMGCIGNLLLLLNLLSTKHGKYVSKS